MKSRTYLRVYGYAKEFLKKLESTYLSFVMSMQIINILICNLIAYGGVQSLVEWRVRSYLWRVA